MRIAVEFKFHPLPIVLEGRDEDEIRRKSNDLHATVHSIIRESGLPIAKLETQCVNLTDGMVVLDVLKAAQRRADPTL